MLVVLHVSRDARYSVPKASPSPGDEQHRVQPYNQMLSSRTIQQSNLSIPGAVPVSDRGVRVLPGGNGHGMNRATMSMARSGFPGMASSPTMNSGSIVSSSMVGSHSPADVHAGSGATQGRLRDSMQIARVSALSFSLTDHSLSLNVQCGTPWMGPGPTNVL